MSYDTSETINPCVDCISLAICCRMKSSELIMKCDDIRSFLTEGQSMEIEHQDPHPGVPFGSHYDITLPRYIIKFNQDNVDIVHSYFRKVQALGI